MARRKYKRKKREYTSYTFWILVGLRLGYKIIAHKSKRLYQWVEPTGEIDEKMTVHAEAVNKVHAQGLIAVDDKKTTFRLTVKGCELADERLDAVTSSMLIDPPENPYQTHDSSLYCG